MSEMEPTATPPEVGPHSLEQRLVVPAAPREGTAATPPELEQVIRFALSELGARNGHHTFEDICRNVAERRIASNILPASGPVSSGGDQGRDVETYHSYLSAELGRHGAFLGLVSDGLIVFTATLQERNLSTKIRADVNTVLSTGWRPASIYAFCVGRLSVAQRHAQFIGPVGVTPRVEQGADGH